MPPASIDCVTLISQRSPVTSSTKRISVGKFSFGPPTLTSALIVLWEGVGPKLTVLDGRGAHPTKGPWKTWTPYLSSNCPDVTRKEATSPGSMIVGGLYAGRIPFESASKSSRRTPVPFRRMHLVACMGYTYRMHKTSCKMYGGTRTLSYTRRGLRGKRPTASL